MSQKLLDSYVSADATHYLHCTHCIGRKSVKHYDMRCIPIKVMADGRVKLIVFGDRNWKDTGHIKHIRYLPQNRISTY